MTGLAPSVPIPSAALLRRFGRRLALAGILVVLGDWLFHSRAIGLSLPVFLAGVAGAVFLTNRISASPSAILGAVTLLAAGLLPALVATTFFSACFAAISLGMFALAVTGQGRSAWIRRPLDALMLIVSGPPHLLQSFRFVRRCAATGRATRLSTSSLLGWVVPLGMLGVFALLFAGANPILAKWIAGFHPDGMLSLISTGRTLLWLFLFVSVWPFVRVRLTACPPLLKPRTGEGVDRLAFLNEHLLGRSAIIRSLWLFNLLFALQTGLDAVYLWGGAALPAGTTYASYAHQGAYPLILTALLAAAFVLVAMRPGGPGEQVRSIRTLVYLFVAQNVGLVLSSILRLDLYVETYSLTGWRLAAFAWMGLVLVGLVLIAARIALRRSNGWLVRANVLALVVTLYGACLVDTSAVIASFNLAHQGKAPGARLDLGYLQTLGVGAVPAIDRALSEDGVIWKRELAAIRDRLVAQRRVPQDWREWDGRSWRLERYLADMTAAALRSVEEKSADR